ncbi:Vomp family autotransporter [Bartonella heixiaziensis]|uniref:Vomp family autotransporter n=1 Tax=Bartonella heixiaziensis TaxID=1461000 RepID=UPI003908B89B
MKKLYSTSNLVKAVSLGTVMTALLSSVSPILAANLAITGASSLSTNSPSVSYPYGSHGSVVFAGDDDFCGADNVVGRGGKQQQTIKDTSRITAVEQYERFVGEKVFNNRSPYGTTTDKVIWSGDGVTTNDGAYMGTPTLGVANAMPEAYGVYSFATGCGSAATGNYSTVFGAGATAKAGGAQAYGVSALASGIASVAMGVDSEASGKSAVAVGGLATALGKNSVAMGTRVRAENNYAIAIGSEAEAQASGAIAIGSRRSDRTESVDPNRKVMAKAQNAIAIGTQAYAETEDSVAIGVNSQVLSKDGVAVGGGSISDRDKGVAGYDPISNGNSTKTDIAWKSTTGAFSVGEVGGRGSGTLTRQITGVAAGSADTDAVNVAQLKAMRDVMAGAGGGWKLSVSNGNPTDVTPGSTVDFSVQSTEVGKDNLTIQKASGDNKQKVQFVLSDTLKLASVTTGQSSMSDDGFMIDKGPTITIDGIDAGKQQITGVADATEDDQAVTYRQLKDIEKATKTSWQLSVNGGDATAIGPNGTVNFQSAGNENKKNIKIEKDENHNVTFDLADDIEVMTVTTGRSIMSAAGFMFTDGNGPSITVNGISAGDQKITKVAKGTEDTDAVNFAQLNEIRNEMAGDSLVKWDEGQELITIGEEKGGVSISVQNNEGKKRVIYGVYNGEVNSNSNDAINGSQLYSTGSNIASYFGGGAKYENDIWTGPVFSILQPDKDGNIEDMDHNNVADAFHGVNSSIANLYNKVFDITKNSLVKWDERQQLITIGKEKGGSSISVQNNQGQKRVIYGVYNGEVNSNSNDAINGSQLYSTGSNIASYFGGGAKYENDIWTGPVFSILQPDKDGIFTSTKYDNVADAFRGVNSSITNLHNRIFDITENSLVKWDEDGEFITIGAEKGGIEIKVANSEGENRIISGVAVGKVSSDSTEAINGHQLFNYAANISEYFGGKTDVIDGFKPTFTVQKKEHHNVTDAFTDVDNSITDIYSQINNVTSNSLIKWDEGQKLITIGTEKGGTKINITGTDGVRTIAGVKNGKISEDSTEAINGSQINKISGDIAKFFGGNAAFQDGAFVGPRYNLSRVSADGKVERQEYTDVGKALEGLDVNVKNVNNRLTYVTNEFDQKFDKFSQDALLWSEGEQAFVALHVQNEEKKESKITYLLNGDITEESTDAINGSQLHSMGSQIANYFGGGASFETGVFTGPKYNLSHVGVDGKVEQKRYNDVGSALTGLDTNIKNVNQGLINAMNDVARYFGGGAGYGEDGNWYPPTFNVIQFKNDGTSSKQPYSNVADAFEGVNNSFTNIHNQILDIKQNSLVQQEEDSGLITIGSQTDGTEIDITGTDGERIITGVSEGEVTEDSTDAINGSQLHSMGSQIANYFGGGASYKNGKWSKPTFKISQRNEDGTIVEKKHHNVADAFEGVDNSITDIYNQINNVTENSLVKQEGENGLITIGKATGGTKISIANKNNEERTLSGVKNATLSIISTEAVNGSQLFTTNQNVSAVTSDLKKVAENTSKYFGGNTDVLAGIEPTFLIQDNTYHNVTDAFTGVNVSITNLDNKIIEMKENNLVKQDGGASGVITIGAKTAGTEINIAGVGGLGRTISGVKAAEKGDEAVNKDQLDKSIGQISKDALLWDDAEQAFVALHEKDGEKTKSKLTFLMNGEIHEESTDAINGSQLYFMSNQLAAYFGGGAKYENGKWTAPSFLISQVNADGKIVENKYNNVAEAFGGINNGMSNINNRIDDVINKVDSDALKWNKDKGAYDASHGSQPSKIINVADGAIAKDSKDAVNGGQLWQTNERITKVENKVDKISNAVTNINDTVINIENRVDDIEDRVDDLVDGVVLYDRDENGEKINKVTLVGGNESEPVTIDNVANGRIGQDSKEAVNGGQLHDYTQEQMKIILDQSKHYTDQRVNNIVIDAIDDAVERANNYTNMKFEALNYRIENVRKEAKQAAAIGLAVSNLRYNDTPGKLSVAFGSGLWRGQSAFALGAGYSSEDGKIRSNLSATSSGGHWGVGVGLNLTLN